MKSLIKNILIIMIISLSGCVSGTQVNVSVPDVEKGTLVARNLKDNQIVFQKDFESSQVSFTRSQVYLGGNDLRLEILDENGNKSLAAVVAKDFQGQLVNVNALTSLASCLYDRYQKSSDFESSKTSSFIDQSNKTIEDHFEIENILSDVPDANYKDVESLSGDIKYSLVLQTFANVSEDYQDGLSTVQFTQYLCDDLAFDGYLNGIDASGFITLENKIFSSQTLKANFAGALYRTFQKEIPTLSDENIFSQANTISVDHTADLFDPNVKNYFFENEPPEDIEWISAIPDTVTNDFIEFNVHDQMNAPVTIVVTVVFTDTENEYSIPNDLPSQDYFISNDIPSHFTETGDATLKIVASDVFGSSRSWSYQVQY